MTELSNDPAWWRTAVVYQIYPRSFADASGSGMGDLRGITDHLEYVHHLGADAIWLSPFYPSPQVDSGYDVSDYTDVDPMFGTMADFDQLLHRAHSLGLRVIIDLVPNHCSDQHPLFQAALQAGPGSPERELFHFLPGLGPGGDEPPNNWGSVFGGSSWTRITEADGTPGPWYYHLFAAEQPDFNWNNPKVLEYFDGVLRFWLDRGVDGFRIDVSDALIKDTSWPNTADGSPVIPKDETSAVHDIYRHFRSVMNEYHGSTAVIETGAPDEEVALFLRPDEMHQAFNFRFLKTPWDGAALSEALAESVAAFAAVGAPTTWVTENHDTTRSVSRYGAPVELSGSYIPTVGGAETLSAADLQRGTARARAMALLFLSLPGGAYIYSGQELGLPQVTDLPEEVLTDPGYFRSGGESPSRDGCRVPIPWEGTKPPFSFSTSADTWLPQPTDWADLTVAAEEDDPESMLRWYQLLLGLRRAEPSLGTGHLEWISEVGDPNRLHLRLTSEEGRPLEVLVNFGPEPLPVASADVVAASAPLLGNLLPVDAAALIAPGH